MFLTGGEALSVDIPITVLIFLSIETLAILLDPTILESMVSNGYFSERSTNLVAAACIIISGFT